MDVTGTKVKNVITIIICNQFPMLANINENDILFSFIRGQAADFSFPLFTCRTLIAITQTRGQHLLETEKSGAKTNELDILISRLFLMELEFPSFVSFQIIVIAARRKTSEG